MEILYVIVGLCAGLFAGFFWSRSRSQNSGREKELGEALQKNMMETAAARETLRVETERRQQTEQLLQREREQINLLVADNATLKTEWNNTQQRLQEHKKELSDLQEQMAVQFRNLANEIFEEKSKKFTDQNKVNILNGIHPFRNR
jgi:DNA recombination protein RmuC